MLIFYNLIFIIFVIGYLPLYLFRRRFHHGFLGRLGLLPQDLLLDQPIWLHAVSVGEAMAVRGLVRELRKVYPEKKFVISTVTATGNKIARGIAREGDLVAYLPLDLSFIVRSVINRINPSMFILAETEIWPNLISYLEQKKIPIIVVNGRISDNSFRGYLAIKFLLKPILNKVTLFCVQTDLDAQRLMRLGVLEGKIKVTGNMKFDVVTDYTECSYSSSDSSASRRDASQKRAIRDTDYRLKLKLAPEERLFIAASTHPSEEEIILTTYKELLGDFSNLRLLLAPRHPERAKEVEHLVIKKGFNPIFISNLQLTTYNLQPTTVFILDTIGELISFYAIADIVFVGGSLIKKGGHNILEPAALGKPVLFGPYMFNFRDIADLFLKNQAALSVHHPEELKAQIKYLLNNPAKASALTQRAKEIILKNQGVTARNRQFITSLIPRLTN